MYVQGLSYPGLTHWGRDKMAVIFQTTFSNNFSWIINAWISIKISLKFVPKGPIDNIPALVQIMAWHRQVTSHYRNQWWLDIDAYNDICITRPNESTRSISWLLMPWLLASPGHQQPWYSLYKLGRSWSYTRKDFNYQFHINVEEW